MFKDDWSKVVDDEALKLKLEQIKNRLNMSGFVFAYTPVSQRPDGQPGGIKRFLSSGIDESALDEWFSKTSAETISYRPLSHNFDPVRAYMVQQLLPQRIMFRDFLAKQAGIRNVLATNWVQTLINKGLRETFYTPIFTGKGEFWSLGVLRHQDNDNQEDLDEWEYAYLNWATTQLAWICIERLGWRESSQPKSNRELTQRELDCLFWTAQGHSAGEVAEVLSISTETARKHIKNSMKKLNARNKTQAVVSAHRLGILNLN